MNSTKLTFSPTVHKLENAIGNKSPPQYYYSIRWLCIRYTVYYVHLRISSINENFFLLKNINIIFRLYAFTNNSQACRPCSMVFRAVWHFYGNRWRFDIQSILMELIEFIYNSYQKPNVLMKFSKNSINLFHVFQFHWLQRLIIHPLNHLFSFVVKQIHSLCIENIINRGKMKNVSVFTCS